MEIKHWCKDNRLEATGRVTKSTGNLNHQYKCPLCDTPYSWGQNSGSLLCNKCETLFVPYVDQSIYNEDYKDKYVKYENTEANFQLQVNRWATVYKHKKNGSLLDYGCGSGAFLSCAPDYPKCDFSLWGTEINEYCLSHCKNKNLNTVELHEALDRRWDVITMFDVLEHVPNLNILSEISDALNDGGILVIATPNLTKEICKNLKDWKHFRPYGEHTFYFSSKSMQAIAEIYDFKLIETNDNESKIRGPAGNIATYVLQKS